MFGERVGSVSFLQPAQHAESDQAEEALHLLPLTSDIGKDIKQGIPSDEISCLLVLFLSPQGFF